MLTWPKPGAVDRELHNVLYDVSSLRFLFVCLFFWCVCVLLLVFLFVWLCLFVCVCLVDGHIYRESLHENDNPMKQDTHKCRFVLKMIIWR